MRHPWALSVLFLLLLASATSPHRASADGQRWTARLVGLTASYGQESWKYDLAYEGQADPSQVASHLANATTSYYGAVGLRATLRVEVFDPADPTSDVPSIVNLTAAIQTIQGPNSALVKREGTSRTFQLDFDLDGADNADPRGRVTPPVEPGVKDVAIKILERVNNPTPMNVEVGDASMRFSYDVPYVRPVVPSDAGLLYAQPTPDSIFRLFNDVGYDRSVMTVFRSIAGGDDVRVESTYGIGLQGRAVELHGYLAERAAPQPTPAGPVPAPVPQAPFVPGVSDNPQLAALVHNTDRLVLISEKLLATSTVDASGLVTFTVKGSDLLNVRNPAPPGALVLLATVLPTNFDRVACPGDCLGGPEFHVGAGEVMVPVAAKKFDVYGFMLQGSGTAGVGAPDPLRQAALSTNALQVLVHDPGGYGPDDPREGDVVAIVPDARSDRPLSVATLAPSDYELDPNGKPTFLSGSVPVRGIQDQHITFYRVLAFLYGANDVFEGATFADRGYTVELAAPVAHAPPGTGGLYVNITSRTTNYDLAVDEPRFAIDVLYSIRAPDVKANVTKTVTVKEARTESVFFPIAVNTPSTVTTVVNTTSGDTNPVAQSKDVVFTPPPAKKGFADKIPGFEGTLAFAALLALALRRRR